MVAILAPIALLMIGCSGGGSGLDSSTPEFYVGNWHVEGNASQIVTFTAGTSHDDGTMTDGTITGHITGTWEIKTFFDSFSLSATVDGYNGHLVTTIGKTERITFLGAGENPDLVLVRAK